MARRGGSEAAEALSEGGLTPLCPYAAAPAAAPDPVDVPCALERASFLAAAPPERDALHVVAYNLERGMRWRGQLELLRSHPDLAGADVLLLSEADRGCSRVGGAHVARELARGLGMELVFAAQYVELPRRSRRPVNRIEAPCEHGNAILSRHPLEDVRALRHATTVAWLDHPREPRLGGCVTLATTIRWRGLPVRLYGVHFDSGLAHDTFRVAQAWDVVADAATHRGPVVVGGDTNAYRYLADVWLGTHLDPTVPVFTGAGLRDAHATLPPWRRGTTGRRFLLRGVIDLILARDLAIEASGVVPARAAGGLSDHLPVWARLSEPLRVPQPR